MLQRIPGIKTRTQLGMLTRQSVVISKGFVTFSGWCGLLPSHHKPDRAVDRFESRSRQVSPLQPDSAPPLHGGRVMLVSETWKQINGVSTTVDNLKKQLEDRDFTVKVLYPALFPTIPTNHPGMRISNPIGLTRRVGKEIENFKPERIFILTETPLGSAAKAYCQKKKLPYSTSFSIKWDDYLKQHFAVPKTLTYKWLKGFHEKASSVLVITPSLLQDLQQRGFKNLVLWRQAINTERFHLLPEQEREEFIQSQGLADKPRPFYLFVGRVSSEKNIEAFLKADLPGTKLIVGPEGAGHALERLKRQYSDAVFTGPKYGDELAKFYASSDVFVFPSKSDTLGLVMLEGLASGLPVVGFNVIGPKDVIEPGSKVGYLVETDQELAQKARQAWQDLQSGQVSRQDCRDAALAFSWPVCINTLLDNLKVHTWKARGTPPAPLAKVGFWPSWLGRSNHGAESGL